MFKQNKITGVLRTSKIENRKHKENWFSTPPKSYFRKLISWKADEYAKKYAYDYD